MLPHLNYDERQEFVLSPIQKLLDHREGEHLLDDLLLSYVQNHISVEGPVASKVPVCWDELFDIVLSYRGIEWHQTTDFVSSGYGTCVVISIFSYGMMLVPSPWESIGEFKGHIERWAKNFGHTPAFFSFLVDFILGPGRALLVDPAPTWIAEAVIRNAKQREFWKSATNGERACDFFAELIDKHSPEIQQDNGLFDRLVRASDILLNNNVRAAAELQQRLSILERRA